MHSLLDTLARIPIAFVDVETTGSSADWGDRVTEVGVARYENGVRVGECGQLVNPQRKIAPGVIALTGITNEMVANQPTFAEALPGMLPILDGAVIVGHNVRFDLSFLNREFRRVGVEMSARLSRPHVLDTVRIARRRFGRGGNGLQRLCRNFGYVPGAAHRALADAISTAFVFEQLLAPLGGWTLSLCDAIAHQGGPMGLEPASPREPLMPLELEEALEQRKPVMMEYLDARSLRTRRIIEPLELRRRNGEIILIAHCQLRNDRRTFKVDRIVQLIRVADVEAPLFDEVLKQSCDDVT